LAAGLLSATLYGQTTLEPGRITGRELADGQAHEYSFGLEAGQYARVSVDQRSINVTVAVFAPDGKELYSGDSYAIGESEIAALIAEVSGNFRLRVTPSEPRAPSGRYAIVLEDVEPAMERHRMHAAGTVEFARGMGLCSQGTREALLQAIEQLGSALTYWRDAQDRAAESRALLTTALFHAEAGNQKEAIEFANRALRQDSHDPLAEARALDALGQVQHYFGDKREAITHYTRALLLTRTAGDRAAVGNTLSNLAVAYSRTGDKRKSLASLDEPMGIFRELQDRRMIADVASNMAQAGTSWPSRAWLAGSRLTLASTTSACRSSNRATP
jgi:tetratricopeptide (TPR) repeat protein